MKSMESQNSARLSPALYRHLSACDRCRAGLLPVRVRDPWPGRRGAEYSCERCQPDLAAFIDLELDTPAQAAATYPHVWWHLWVCPTCAQVYKCTHALLAAERSGRLLPLRRLVCAAPRPAPAIRRVCLTRQILALAIPRAAGTLTRGPNNAYVLFEALDGQLTIAVRKHADNLWQMAVTAIPPPDGLLVLSSGTLLLIAPFDPNGQATIGNISADTLLDPEAPDIEVGIVPAEEPGAHIGHVKK